MVDLVLAGREPDDLAREFEPTGQSIRAWVAKASQKEGRQGDAAVALAAPLPSATSWCACAVRTVTIR
jgi:transposase